MSLGASKPKGRNRMYTPRTQRTSL